jgi:hypothetical protein
VVVSRREIVKPPANGFFSHRTEFSVTLQATMQMRARGLTTIIISLVVSALLFAFVSSVPDLAPNRSKASYQVLGQSPATLNLLRTRLIAPSDSQISKHRLLDYCVAQGLALEAIAPFTITEIRDALPLFTFLSPLPRTRGPPLS